MDQKTLEKAAPQRDKMRISRLSRNKIKVLIAMFFAVIFGAFGDISIRYGMRAVEATKHACIYSHFVCAATNPFVWIGVLLLVLFFILYLTSLSWEELSYVLPLTAADYVLVTILAFFLLGEDVSPMRWAGSLLVATGIALVVRT
ncbi:MAG: EamA family transporter [Armatimonadota bacterium]